MRECIEPEVLQSYFDNELSTGMRRSVRSHLISCTNCAVAAAEIENENLLLASALAPEFDLPVPTERLRSRISEAIAESKVSSTELKPAYSAKQTSWFESFTSLFAFSPQRAFGYAGLALMLVFAGFVGIIWLQDSTLQERIVEISVPEVAAPSPTVAIDRREGDQSSLTEGGEVGPVPGPPRQVKPKRSRVGQPAVANSVQLLPGERSYLKTIALLNSSIKGNTEIPMRPALQAEFERNLALVDEALAAARAAAKSNPNDPVAAEFMFAAYQSKVDLLNTVADARMYNRR